MMFTRFDYVIISRHCCALKTFKNNIDPFSETDHMLYEC